MAHLDSNYRDTDYDRITHSTPKTSRDNYGSAVSSSYVTQSVKKARSSSTRSSGYSSEDGHNDILNSRIGEPVNSSTYVESYGVTSTNGEQHRLVDRPMPPNLGFEYEDIDSFRARQKIEGDRLQVHRKSLTGNIVGTGQLNQSVTSGAGTSGDVTSYSSRITSTTRSSDGTNDPLSRENLLAEARARRNDISGANSSSVTTTSYSTSNASKDPNEYKYSSRLSSSNDDAAGSNHPTSSSYGGTRESALLSSRYTSGLSRSVEDILGSSSSRYTSSRDSALSPTRYSSVQSNSREGINTSKDPLTGRNIDSSIYSSRYSSGLSRSTEDILNSSRVSDPTSSKYASDLSNSSKYKDPLSRESLLAEARSKDSGLYSSRYSSGLSRSIEDILGSSTNRDPLTSYSSRYSSDLSTRLSSPTSSTNSKSLFDDKVTKSDQLGVPQDDRVSKSDALVAKYLQSSRHKNISKYTSDADLDLKSRHSPLRGIKEEEDTKGKTADVKHHSAGGKPMSYLPSSANYEDLLQERRKSEAEERYQ